MYKYSITILLIVGLGFSYGVRPAFDVGFSWTNMKFSYDDYYEDITEDYMVFSIATSVPYSKAVGLYVELAAITFYENVTSTNIGGGGVLAMFTLSGFGSKIGLIEMIPSKSVSPFFKQYIVIDILSGDYYDMTMYAFGFNAGVEFFSSSNMSPLFEVHTTVGSYEGSTNVFSYGVGFSLRFSWEK